MRFRRRAALLASAVALAGATTQQAVAEPNDKNIITGPVADSAIWALQTRIDDVIADIRATAGADGISGVVVDLDNSRLQLSWKGDLPAGVADRVKQARAEGITVDVRQAPYTEAELKAEVDRISRKPLFKGEPTGQRMLMVNPRPDGSGLDVGVHGLPSGFTPQQARDLVPALDSGYPLWITETEPMEFTTRLFDTPPFWGGSYVLRRADRNYWCSSGFGTTGLNGSSTYLMSAAHCGEGAWGSYQRSDGSQNIYGNTIPAGRILSIDVQLVHTPAGAGSSVYWGPHINPPDPGAGSARAVAGSVANSVGNAFCLSASFSGTICEGTSMRVTAVDTVVVYTPAKQGVSRVTNLVRGYDPGRSAAIVGEGDSGGPAVSLQADGRLLGRGIISGGLGGLAPCVGYVFPSSRPCWRIVLFADLHNAMAMTGVRLNTG